MKNTDTVIQSLIKEHQIMIAGVTDVDVQQKYCSNCVNI